MNKLNLYLLLNLPSAFMCGVRVTKLNKESCSTSLKHKWINKNPFKSIFWAVQGMAAELSTGLLLNYHLKNRKSKYSMLVIKNESSFHKKATGKIIFECFDTELILDTIKRSDEQNLPQTVTLTSKGVNEKGIVVSEFSFLWSIKKK